VNIVEPTNVLNEKQLLHLLLHVIGNKGTPQFNPTPRAPRKPKAAVKAVEAPQDIRLDANSLKGNQSSFELNQNTFTKKKSDHCSISTFPISGDFTARIRYSSIDSNGWLLIGVHNSPQAATATSCNDNGFVGLNVTKIGNMSNREWIRGKFTDVGTMTVADRGIIDVRVAGRTLSISTESWKRDIAIPNDFQSPWHLHFDPYGASFEILK
jgi:hypothetical protein